MERDFDYENSNIAYYDQEDCDGIKCKNYQVCNEVLPKWWFDCKGHYRCVNCDVMFRENLEFINNIECPICLDIKKGVKQLQCNHCICIKCFKRCYYGDETREGEPIFPYPDIEDEYYDDTDNPKWDNDYPLLKKYNKHWNRWDGEISKKYNNEQHLRKCPLCRK